MIRATSECSDRGRRGRASKRGLKRLRVWAVWLWESWCYVLGLTQGAFFIFHLLTKPFPSCDQPPTHLDHMTNHLTSHLTTHMTSHMPFQSPAPLSHLCITWYSLTWPHMTLSLPLTRLYSLTSASLPDPWPAYYTFFIASFCDSYWLSPCYFHAWVSSAVYDSTFWAMTCY